jgi:hypothetical protein
MKPIEMTLDFSGANVDKETLETLTQVLFTQLSDLDVENVERIHEAPLVGAKSAGKGRPKSGWLSLVFDSLKSSRILKFIIARLLGKQVKFKKKHRGKEITFESQSLSQQEVLELIDLINKL